MSEIYLHFSTPFPTRTHFTATQTFFCGNILLMLVSVFIGRVKITDDKSLISSPSRRMTLVTGSGSCGSTDVGHVFTTNGQECHLWRVMSLKGTSGEGSSTSFYCMKPLLSNLWSTLVSLGCCIVIDWLKALWPADECKYRCLRWRFVLSLTLITTETYIGM